MRRVSAAEANRNFARIMKEAESGETLIVTSHGKPRVRIEKVGPSDEEGSLRAKREALWRVHRYRLMGQPVLNLGRFSREWAYED